MKKKCSKKVDEHEKCAGFEVYVLVTMRVGQIDQAFVLCFVLWARKGGLR